MKRATSFPVFLLSLFLSLTLSGASWGRWYSAGAGRFLSEDEIGASQKRLREAHELDGFGYAAGNPTKWTDPAGLDVGASRVLSEEERSREDNGAALLGTDPYDVVRNIAWLRKPADVVDFWVGLDDESKSLPLTELEHSFAQARDISVPGTGVLTPASLAHETRRAIISDYFSHHPATQQLYSGAYRLARDSNPFHMAFERGWQIWSGREMLTGDKVSRVDAAAELATALVITKYTNDLLEDFRPVTGNVAVSSVLNPSGRGGSRLVAYGSDTLSQQAITYRIANNMWGGRNVAVFEYESEGQIKTLSISSRGPTAPDLEPELGAGFGHAEKRGLNALQKMGILRKSVRRIYTELEPCEAPGNYCARNLATQVPGVPVTYSFHYTTPSDGTAVAILKAAAGEYNGVTP